MDDHGNTRDPSQGVNTLDDTLGDKASHTGTFCKGTGCRLVEVDHILLGDYILGEVDHRREEVDHRREEVMGC